MNFDELFERYKVEELSGRYITNMHIGPLLKNTCTTFQVTVAGVSVMEKPIHCIAAGTGETRIFIWSQMHGNETTATKAIFDFLNFLKSNDPFAVQLKSFFTFLVLPIVNPDGAEMYTRENANKIDLNRDALNLSQPESKVLRAAFEAFKPHYCYNMHDQRTIFGAGDTGKPATVSFLAPSYDPERSINSTRQAAINVISAMNDVLQEYIPGQVGRFDDSFNINCIGDMFQSQDVPTVLFEAGHYPDDYLREKTRKYIFIALLTGFKAIYENVIVVNKSDDYFLIPQNKINFYDFIYRNIKINYENKQKITNFASHYKEVLFENSVIFKAYISEIGTLTNFYAHNEYNGGGELFRDMEGDEMPQVHAEADFTVGLNRRFINGSEK